jgi:hypothetical protein
VIHIATVHWRDDRWIEPQRRYLERNIEAPFRLYADLEGIDAPAGSFDHIADLASTRGFDSPILSHTEKLNALADHIGHEAKDEDLLMFLDGDGFPIAPLDTFLRETLARYPLTAVRRDENLHDVHPHPCFCATTVGFWKELDGDWNPGHTWLNAAGKQVADAGGNVLARLQERGADWCPLLRSNRGKLHPLWFGVYGDLVYHHGAGFRAGLSRMEREAIGHVPEAPRDLVGDESLAQRLAWRFRARRWYLFEKRPVVRRERRALERNSRLSARVFERLQVDPTFWKEL